MLRAATKSLDASSYSIKLMTWTTGISCWNFKINFGHGVWNSYLPPIKLYWERESSIIESITSITKVPFPITVEPSSEFVPVITIGGTNQKLDWHSFNLNKNGGTCCSKMIINWQKSASLLSKVTLSSSAKTDSFVPFSAKESARKTIFTPLPNRFPLPQPFSADPRLPFDVPYPLDTPAGEDQALQGATEDHTP